LATEDGIKTTVLSKETQKITYIVIDGNIMLWMSIQAAEAGLSISSTADPSKKPATFKAIPLDGKARLKPRPGYYQLDGDNWLMFYTKGDAPKDFAIKEGDEVGTKALIYERKIRRKSLRSAQMLSHVLLSLSWPERPDQPSGLRRGLFQRLGVHCPLAAFTHAGLASHRMYGVLAAVRVNFDC